MKEPPIPLYVRLAAEHARSLEEAVSLSGKSKRQIIEEAVQEHLADKGLTVGRVALREDAPTRREDAPEILTASEAAALLRVPESELTAAAARGELPGRAIGEEWRFSRAALLAWLRRDQGTERTETVLDTGLEYVPGEPVRVRVVHREHSISVTDDGAAMAKAGHPAGWREAAERVADELVVNISRQGVVSLPVVRVGPPEEEVVTRIGTASLALYQELLDLDEE
jgi:excisionase family DNA binding protein